MAEKWVEKVFDVKRFSDRIILLRLVVGKVVFTFIFMYAPQAGLSEAEKVYFFNLLQSAVSKIPASEVLIPLGDWNGHMGSEGCGFEEVHGGKGFGVRNAEGERLLEFAVANDLVVGNTRLTKRESHLAIYCSGINKSHYILYRIVRVFAQQSTV